MAYVEVPKDLTRVKQKILFNLTKRQLLCFSIAGALGVPFYFLTREFLGTTISAFLMVLIILPFFLFALYEKDGRPLEKILKDMYQQKVKRPGIRTYRTKNIYSEVQDILEMEGKLKNEGKS